MILGRLTRDPELRAIPSGVSVCQLGVATSYVYNNQQTGQKVEQTEFHNVVLWRKLGEIAAQYLKKGSQVFIEGRLQTRSWDGKDGVKRYRTEIVGDNLIMLGRPQASSGSATPPATSVSSAPIKEGVEQPAPSDSSAAASAEAEELPTIQQGEDINVEDIPF
jgi:single-strand DNA-binding protein